MSSNDEPRIARLPLRGSAGVVDLPGLDRNKEIKLKVLVFTGQHWCGCPTEITLTGRGNVGQPLKNISLTLDMIPAIMCEQCGNDLKGTELILDAQYGENPIM